MRAAHPGSTPTQCGHAPEPNARVIKVLQPCPSSVPRPSPRWPRPGAFGAAGAYSWVPIPLERVLTTLRLPGRGGAALWRFASLLALLAQCWIAAAPLGEARGFGASAHVEASGTSQHYAHDEADCASCRTLALTALPLLESPRLALLDASTAAVAARPISAPRAVTPLHTRPRAPQEIA